MSGIEELIERLEKATGPDRELDAAIALSIGWQKVTPYFAVDPNGARYGGPPRYTASLEAALTLVRQDAYPRIMKTAPDKWEAHLGFGNRANGQNGESSTPPIALCIAALKARAVAEPA